MDLALSPAKPLPLAHTGPVLLLLLVGLLELARRLSGALPDLTPLWLIVILFAACTYGVRARLICTALAFAATVAGAASADPTLSRLDQWTGVLLLAVTAPAALALVGLLRRQYERPMRELRQSEARLCALNRAVDCGILVRDRSGMIVEANDAAERIFGLTKEQIIGHTSEALWPAMEVINGAPGPRVRRYLEALETGRPVRDVSVSIIRPDGERRWLQLNVVPMMGEDGAPDQAVSSIVDVTPLAQTERALRESEERYRDLFENANDMVYTHDLNGAFTSINRTAEAVTGYTQQQLVTMNIADLLAPEHLALARSRIAEKAAGGGPTRYEVDIIRSDGGRRAVEVNTRAILEDGRPVGVHGIARDITERRRAEEALRESEERFRRMAETMSEVFWIASPDGQRLHYLSPAVDTIWGRPRQSFDDEPAALMRAVHPADRERAAAAWSQGPEAGKWEIEYRIIRPDGAVRWIWVRSSPVRSEAGELTSLAGIATDITDRKLAEQAIARQALHDPLTDLPNRTLLHDRLTQAVAVARRTSGSVALMIVDLDHFKEVNDTLGHHWGDQLLRQVARRLAGGLDPADTVARLGGDEFAVLLPHADRNEAMRQADRILEELEQPFGLEGQAVAIGGSIGIAICPEHSDDGETLLRQADVALYVAKRARSGAAVYSADEDRHSPGRLALAGELRRAIEHDELELFYQPKLDMRTGRLVRLEALLRWRRPQHGLLLPDRFIPLAEQTGLIRLVTWWALNAALRQCHYWREAGLTAPMAVNLSMRDLHDPQLPEIVAELLGIWEAPPEWLTLEITESLIMADPERTLATLQRLQTLGTPLALDDFGEGYTSLSYLQRLPLDHLKIGQTFVSRMTENVKSLAIVRSTIELGHNLGLAVVAEGIANQECWDLLAGMGCDMAQGYFISPPLPAADLERWLRTGGFPSREPV